MLASVYHLQCITSARIVFPLFCLVQHELRINYASRECWMPDFHFPCISQAYASHCPYMPSGSSHTFMSWLECTAVFRMEVFSPSSGRGRTVTRGVIWYRHTAHLQYIKPPLPTRKTSLYNMVIF